jgi:hypothetical protein
VRGANLPERICETIGPENLGQLPLSSNAILYLDAFLRSESKLLSPFESGS